MKRILSVILLLGLGAGGWQYWDITHRKQEKAPLVLHGNVDIREVRLGFRVGGRVLEVLKDEGEQVAAGEIVARLDAEPFAHAEHQAEAQLGQLSARLQELRHGNRPQEIEQAAKNLAATEASLDVARLTHERQRQLVATGAVARQDYDTARTALQAAQARRDATLAALRLLQAGTRAEQIAQAEAAVEVAAATLAQARTQLGDAVLKAAENGVILTRAVEPGSMVQAGTTALTVSLLDPIRVRAYAPEPYLGQIVPGRDVLVYTDSRREPYHGRIGDVSPRAEFTPKSVETEELRTALVYRFRIAITDSDPLLRQGMPVTVRLGGN